VALVFRRHDQILVATGRCGPTECTCVHCTVCCVAWDVFFPSKHAIGHRMGAPDNCAVCLHGRAGGVSSFVGEIAFACGHSWPGPRRRLPILDSARLHDELLHPIGALIIQTAPANELAKRPGQRVLLFGNVAQVTAKLLSLLCGAAAARASVRRAIVELIFHRMRVMIDVVAHVCV
jgi:hypothetical protein